MSRGSACFTTGVNPHACTPVTATLARICSCAHKHAFMPASHMRWWWRGQPRRVRWTRVARIIHVLCGFKTYYVRTVPHLPRDSARRCHICTGTRRLNRATSAPGLGHADGAGMTALRPRLPQSLRERIRRCFSMRPPTPGARRPGCPRGPQRLPRRRSKSGWRPRRARAIGRFRECAFRPPARR